MLHIQYTVLHYHTMGGVQFCIHPLRNAFLVKQCPVLQLYNTTLCALHCSKSKLAHCNTFLLQIKNQYERNEKLVWLNTIHISQFTTTSHNAVNCRIKITKMYKWCISPCLYFDAWFRFYAVLSADKWSAGVAAGVWQLVIASLFGLVAAISQLYKQHQASQCAPCLLWPPRRRSFQEMISPVGRRMSASASKRSIAEGS